MEEIYIYFEAWHWTERDVDIYFDVTVRRCDIYDSNHWRVLNPAGPLLLRDEQQIISVGSTPPLSTTDLF